MALGTDTLIRRIVELAGERQQPTIWLAGGVKIGVTHAIDNLQGAPGILRCKLVKGDTMDLDVDAIIAVSVSE